jgi:hypothetical protein
MSEIDNPPYNYVGIALTPSIIETLILQLFAGRIIERQTIEDEVSAYHAAKGGQKSKGQNILSGVKRALTRLKEKGKADNPSYGYWRISQDETVETLALSAPFEEDVLSSFDEIVPESEPISDILLGEGKSSIYLYYLPLYRQNAERLNEKVWHCKIGRTDRDPLIRILTQASTALPEKPHIGLVFKTNYPLEYEHSIHCILTIRGRKIDSSPGAEWYLTSPDEVQEIISFISTESNLM